MPMRQCNSHTTSTGSASVSLPSNAYPHNYALAEGGTNATHVFSGQANVANDRQGQVAHRVDISDLAEEGV
eukprot:scaffold353_cov17-Prasinocladus_malaysianus.AAC.1